MTDLDRRRLIRSAAWAAPVVAVVAAAPMAAASGRIEEIRAYFMQNEGESSLWGILLTISPPERIDLTADMFMFDFLRDGGEFQPTEVSQTIYSAGGAHQITARLPIAIKEGSNWDTVTATINGVTATVRVRYGW